MKILEKLKRNPLVKAVFGKSLRKMYHFLWALFGAIFYPPPSSPMKVIGVTGTKGKTTTLELIGAIFETAGRKTAVLSSLKIKIGGKSEKNLTGNSMPGRGYIQKFIREAARQGADYAVVEVTSEGSAQYRHRFVKWDAAVLTNLAPEHIESHGSFEAYREAKFSFLKYAMEKGAKIFLNQADAGSEYFFQNLPAESVRIYSHAMLPELTEEAMEVFPGNFSLDNISAAAAVAEFFGISKEDIRKGINGFKGIPGRLEFVQRKPFAVVVDYAHTPDSLEAVYGTVRPREGRLICVLGSAGGGRDKWKRPMFGKIAAQYCDSIYLTNEDPFDEDPGEILENVAAGIPSEKNYRKIMDRGEAIFEAVKEARQGDAVIITGKGSETWIRVKNGEKMPWSDREKAEEALQKK